VTVRNVGTEAATDVTVPVPAGVTHESVVPFEVSTWPFVPTVVRPVPPFAVGSAVPEYVIARVPDDVIGLPVTVRNVGTEAATDVTVPPVTGRFAHAGKFETRVRTRSVSDLFYLPAGTLYDVVVQKHALAFASRSVRSVMRGVASNETNVRNYLVRLSL
jgi:hypothetical protein